jgi:geranylgeranyl diphosphate synthase type I
MAQELAPPPALTVVAAQVESRLARLFDEELARWKAVDPELKAPLESLRQLVLAGGKRLRPAFCYWAFVGLGGDPADHHVVDAGAALELLHTSALVHDDVIDASRTRHGIDTAHVDFARRHSGARWRGEAQRFGEGVAILAGDLAAVYADRMLGWSPVPAVREIFDELRLELNVGQFLDLVGSVQRDTTLDQARLIARYKSGKYTVERPLHLGAALTDHPRLDGVRAAFSAYGLPLGEAFQLKDDLLGVFGDPSITGKPVGEDLREGKPTMLYALAKERAAGSDARLLADRFGSADLSSDEVAAIQRTFERTEARVDVEDTIKRLVDEALMAVDEIPVTPGARTSLIELAGFVAGRRY